MKYDYLVVGAGLYGAVFAHEAKKKGKNCLVIDKRDHIAGNIYCEEIEGINVHKYVHIFSTHPIRKYGNTSISLQSSIITLTLRLLYIRMNFITCRSI